MDLCFIIFWTSWPNLAEISLLTDLCLKLTGGPAIEPIYNKCFSSACYGQHLSHVIYRQYSSQISQHVCQSYPILHWQTLPLRSDCANVHANLKLHCMAMAGKRWNYHILMFYCSVFIFNGYHIDILQTLFKLMAGWTTPLKEEHIVKQM